MYTIFDYLKYYKNISVDEIFWNTMDNLVCAILVYLPTSFNDSITLSNISIKEKNIKGLMAPKAIEVLNSIKNSSRYKDVVVSNFVKIKDNETQFGACTFKIKDKTIVSFQGTDGSFIGWIENFRIAYLYPTYTQTLAINYLHEVAKSNSNIDVVGHSKGGNLAMSSVMELKEKIK